MLEWFDVDDPDYEPVPVMDVAGETVITDGHTRAFVASLAGADTIEVVPDPDRETLDRELYRACVGWCRERSVTRIADLAGRIVSQETFHERWGARCEGAASADQP